MSPLRLGALGAAVLPLLAWATEYTVEELKGAQPYIALKLAVEEEDVSVLRGILHELFEVQRHEKDTLFSAHTNIFKYTDYTALHYACAIPKREDHVRVLLEAGAGKEREADSGVRPLHVAARHGQVKAAKVLLEAGARATETAVDGMTPATIAAKEGHLEILRALRDFGGQALQSLRERDSNLRDSNFGVRAGRGWAPIEYAVHGGKRDIIRFLTFEVGWGEVELDDLVSIARDQADAGKFPEQYVQEIQLLGRTNSQEYLQQFESYLFEQAPAQSSEL